MKSSQMSRIFIDIFDSKSLVCDLPHDIYIYKGNTVLYVFIVNFVCEFLLVICRVLNLNDDVGEWPK